MSLKNWSRISAATLVGGMVVLGAATPAYAAPGDATGTALRLELNAAVLGDPVLTANAEVADTAYPPGGTVTGLALAAALPGVLGLGADGGVLQSSSTGDAAQSVGTSGVTGLDLTVLGAGITADAITGTATCPVGGPATAATRIAELEVFGIPVTADVTLDAPADLGITVPGLASAQLFAVVDLELENETAAAPGVNAAASATAVSIALSLRTDILGIVATVPIGTIAIGAATCESLPAAAAVPTTASLTPTSGPVAGGTTITVTGTGFVPGATSVTVDRTVVPAASVSVGSATSLTFPAPPHAAGPVLVTVTTPGGTSAPALDYTYVPIPASSGLNPISGPDQGGTTVTVTGSGFVAGQTTVSIGTDTLVPATVTSPTSLTFVTPGDPAGPAQVRVVTPGGTSDPLDFTYVGDPALTGLTPATGPVAGGTTVTVTGANFVPGSTSVTIAGTVVAATVTNPTTLTFVTPAHTAGLVAVTATTPSGTSGPLGFTYLGAPVPGAPTASAIDPATGPTTGGTTVTIDGTGFGPGTTVTVDGVPGTEVTVIGETELTFVTPAGAAPGLVGVVVTTPAGATPPLGFTYVGAAPAAVATSLTPPVGPTTGGTTVTITGSGFVAGQTTVTIGGTTVPATAVTVTSPTSLSFVTPAHAVGAVQVTVTVPAGTSAPLGFTYQAVAPTATGLTPGSGPTTGGTTVTVDGTGFTPGTTVTVDGVRVPVTVLSASRLSFVTPAHAAGSVTVVIGTDGGSAWLTFRYVAGGGSLATTGFDTAVPLTGGALALLAGAGRLTRPPGQPGTPPDDAVRHPRAGRRRRVPPPTTLPGGER